MNQVKTHQTNHQKRVEALREAYRSGRTFPTLVKIRNFLGLEGMKGLDQARRADIEARNDLNADPTTPIVVPAAKVPDPGTNNYARRSRGDADHDLERLLAFWQGIVTQTKNASHQGRKVSDKFPNDIDIMRLTREGAFFAQQAVSMTIEIERVKSTR